MIALALLLCALICALISAFNVAVSQVNLVALALALYFASLLAGHAGAF